MTRVNFAAQIGDRLSGQNKTRLSTCRIYYNTASGLVRERQKIDGKLKTNYFARNLPKHETRQSLQLGNKADSQQQKSSEFRRSEIWSPLRDDAVRFI